jgi:hypothetical protein
MALFILSSTATKAGVVAPEFRFHAPVRLGRCVVMVVSTVGAVHVWFLRLAFWVWHGLVSGQGLKSSSIKVWGTEKLLQEFESLFLQNSKLSPISIAYIDRQAIAKARNVREFFMCGKLNVTQELV